MCYKLCPCNYFMLKGKTTSITPKNLPFATSDKIKADLADNLSKIQKLCTKVALHKATLTRKTSVRIYLEDSVLIVQI